MHGKDKKWDKEIVWKVEFKLLILGFGPIFDVRLRHHLHMQSAKLFRKLT